MNEHEPTEIEERLKALRPAEPDAALRDRIAASLEAETAEPTQTLKFPRPLIYVLAAAACMALAAVLWVVMTNEPSNPTVVESPDESDQTHPEPEPDDAQNTLDHHPPRVPSQHELRLAAQQSPEALEHAVDSAIVIEPRSAAGRTTHVYTIADGRRISLMENLP